MRNQLFAALVILALMVMVSSIIGCAKRTDEASVTPPALPDAELGVTNDAAPAAENVPSAGDVKTLADARKGVKTPKSYEMTMTNADGKNMVQIVTFKDGKPHKITMKDDNGQAIMDMEKKTIIIYSPAEKQAMSMSMDAMGDDAVVIDSSMLAQDAAITGSEKIAGVDCWTSDTSLRGNEQTVKVWIAKKTGLIQKVITKDKDDKTEEISFKYDRINKVKASEFELPAGIKVMSMDDMMKAPAQAQ